MQKIKKFFANLKMTVSVQKGALIRTLLNVVSVVGLVATGIAALAICIKNDGAIDWETAGRALAISGIVFLVLLGLGALIDFRIEYKATVDRSADVIIAKNKKAAEKAQIKAEKAAIKKQNKEAYAWRVKNKYKDENE